MTLRCTLVFFAFHELSRCCMQKSLRPRSLHPSSYSPLLKILRVGASVLRLLVTILTHASSFLLLPLSSTSATTRDRGATFANIDRSDVGRVRVGEQQLHAFLPLACHLPLPSTYSAAACAAALPRPFSPHLPPNGTAMKPPRPPFTRCVLASSHPGASVHRTWRFSPILPPTDQR